MPELPDVSVYVEALSRWVIGDVLEHVRIVSPFALRTFDPPIEAVEGQRVTGVERIGKRIVFALDGGLFVVIHLMIAGRLRWTDTPRPSAAAGSKPRNPPANKITLASFEFGSGILALTEAGTKKRASIHILSGRAALDAMNPAGLDVLTCAAAEFHQRLLHRNNTLKRALTDPRRFDGIGNAYSDEILHAAGLSPLRLTSKMTPERSALLLDAARSTLMNWTAKLFEEFGLTGGAPGKSKIGKFPGPGEITAVRTDFAVHGRFGEPCPVCGTEVQRILYAENECDYCPRCQTDGKLLADRAMSRLLRDDWPKTIEEWEQGNGKELPGAG